MLFKGSNNLVQIYRSFSITGNLKHAADDLYNKALKVFFSVKSKFNNFQEVPLKTCFKLFDSLLKPILTYGSEIWLSDYNINLNNFENVVMYTWGQKTVIKYGEQTRM
jgi:hypothetical protein